MGRAIIETGFHCPPVMPFMYEGAGFGVCGPREGEDPDVIEAIGEEAGYAAGQCVAKVDVLFVVDNSPSMTREQRSLALGFDAVADWVGANGADIHVAVTTVDAMCEQTALKVTSARGLFNTVPARVNPPGAREQEVADCTSNAECEALFGDAGLSLSCDATDSEICRVTPNGSVTSGCVYRCETPAECVVLTGESDALCSNGGCILPPPTAECPDAVSAISTAETLESARCALSVGINQEKCLKFEQPLQAAWMALDPTGENAAQSASFLRDDADLVLVFVGDEDDCSVADGETIMEDDYDTCALLGDTSAGGPLVPVADMVARFRGLKSVDRLVHAVVVNGDSLAPTETAREADRVAYVAAKTDARDCFARSYICDGELGTSDWGQRMQAFAAGFGDEGAFLNVCDGESAESAVMDRIVGLLEADAAARCR